MLYRYMYTAVCKRGRGPQKKAPKREPKRLRRRSPHLHAARTA